MKNCIKWMLFFVVCLCLFGTKVYAKEEISLIVEPRDIAVAVVEVQGNLENGISELKKYTYQVFTENHTYNCPIVWDLRGVKADQVGVYPIKGSMELPKGCVLGEGVTIPEVQTSISVQKRGRPEIHAYYRLMASGLYIFPWLYRENTEDMHAYLKKEGNSWRSLEDYSLCENDALYLVDQAMSPGNIYELVVTYGSSMTNVLRFFYKNDKTLDLLSYEPGVLQSGSTQISRIISSFEKTGSMERCGAFAIPVGGSLDGILKELKDIWILGSTSEVFENTAENPAVELETKWDVASVNRKKPGVYCMKGTLVPPKGYTFKQGIQLPKISVYISVQKKGAPQINTYYVARDGILFFPMVFDGFTEEECRLFEIYVREEKGAYRKLSREEGWIRNNDIEEGVEIFYDLFFKKGKQYSICVLYPGGSTGIYSFIYMGDSFIKDKMTGRNFSDRDEKNLPILVQSDGKNQAEEAEEKDQEKTSDYAENGEFQNQENDTASTEEKNMITQEQSSLVEETTEIVTDTMTVLSGKRLKLMLQEANDFLVFEKSGISLFLPVEIASSWELGDEETLQVMIQKTGEAGFSVRIFVREQEITQLPGAKVELPLQLFEERWDPEESLISDSKGEICQSNYLSEEKLLEIWIHTSGDFFLQTREKEEKSQKDEKVTEIQEEESPEKTSDFPDMQGMLVVLFCAFWGSLYLKKRKR